MLPSYLKSTAYGERYNLQNKKPNDLSKRIYNKLAKEPESEERPGSLNIVPKLIPLALFPSQTVARRELKKCLANHQNGSLGVATVTPSTLPGFRDEPIGLAASPEYSASIVETGESEDYEMDEDQEEDEDEDMDDDNISEMSDEYSNKNAYRKKQSTDSTFGVPELPSRWLKGQLDTSVMLLRNGRIIEGKTEYPNSGQESHALKTDNFIPEICGVYYYEVKILSCLREPFVSLGFCTQDASLAKVPGLEPNSWGYHSDDGRTTFYPTYSYSFGPSYGNGDVIGCGIDFSRKSIFFTKNGLYLGNGFTDLETKYIMQKLYPCIGYKTPLTIKANFGQEMFMFDIDLYVRNRKENVVEKIKRNKSLPKKDDADISNMMKQLVSSYFSYLGYHDTGKAFLEETSQEREIVRKLDGEDAVELNETEDEEDIIHRQIIKRLIIEGKADEALEMLKEYYPTIAEEKDSLVVFKLQCSKFIELVRATIPDQNNETDENACQSLVSYGQELRNLYKSDPREAVTSHLAQCFSLLAYEDPRQDDSVAYLLEEKERVRLAEDVNSKILVSFGKSPVPLLKTVTQHTMNLVYELQNQGAPDVNVLNIHNDFL